MSIGILGGTFDPIHMGHLMIAEYIRDDFAFDKIIFVPAGNPPLKNYIITSKKDRLNMVKLAIEDNPYFLCCDLEMKNHGKSYTVDTVEKIKEKYPSEEIFFILGQDAAIDLNLWHRYEDFVRETNLIVVSRDMEQKDEIRGKYAHLNPKFVFVDTPSIEISSTKIRDRIKQGKSIKYMVDKKVYEYIIKKGLYI